MLCCVNRHIVNNPKFAIKNFRNENSNQSQTFWKRNNLISEKRDSLAFKPILDIQFSTTFFRQSFFDNVNIIQTKTFWKRNNHINRKRDSLACVKFRFIFKFQVFFVFWKTGVKFMKMLFWKKRFMRHNVPALCVCCEVRNWLFSAKIIFLARNKRNYTTKFAIAQNVCYVA